MFPADVPNPIHPFSDKKGPTQPIPMLRGPGDVSGHGSGIDCSTDPSSKGGAKGQRISRPWTLAVKL